MFTVCSMFVHCLFNDVSIQLVLALGYAMRKTVHDDDDEAVESAKRQQAIALMMLDRDGLARTASSASSAADLRGRRRRRGKGAATVEGNIRVDCTWWWYSLCNFQY